jgi:hypothetical protein
VWANFSESHGPWSSVVVTRTYKDGNGNYKAAGSFGRDDLLVVGEVTRLAYHWVMRQRGSGARIPDGDDGGEDTPFWTAARQLGLSTRSLGPEGRFTRRLFRVVRPPPRFSGIRRR